MFKCIPFARCNRHVEAIDKRHQNLTSFPDEIVRYHRTLEELLLDSNQLHELPKGFYKLTLLRKLDISDNEIEVISPEIGNFVNLVEFDCNRNGITELPDSIRYLRNLQVLDISNNPLKCLPSGLTQLRALTELTLNDLSLEALPEDIGNLANLRSFQARDNLIKNIPESLCNMSKLESLDLGSNEIEEIPVQVGKLASLKVLWLDLNQLKEVPAEIGRLKKLQYLELSENMLERLPDEVCGCVALTDLNLAQNSIEVLPATIGQLANLSILKLEQNQLVVLTPSIGQCAQLSELILTENLLSELPASLGNLRLLNNLNADRNRLGYLPDSICECENLGLLSLRENQLAALPEDIGNLQKLRVLDVAGNKLGYLPMSLTRANLNAIWLAENQATGKIKLQPDFDEETQKSVLTCYLLPQQNFQTPSMENLLQGSINTAENGSQAGLLNNNMAAQQQQQYQHAQQQLQLQQQKQAEQLQQHRAEEKHVPNTSESVRFAPESDNEEKLSHFVRTNTPHPKELAKKKEMLKQKTSNSVHISSGNGPTSSTVDSSSYVSESSGAVGLPQISINAADAPRLSLRGQAGQNNRSVNVGAVTTGASSTDRNTDLNTNGTNDDQETAADNEDDGEETDGSKMAATNGSYVNKHVDFKLGEKVIINDVVEQVDAQENEEEEAENENENEDGENSANNTSGHCRLRRRDTPHHLKGARVNTAQSKAQPLDPNEMREILERYTNASSSPDNSPTNHNAQLGGKHASAAAAAAASKPKPASVYVPPNFHHDELRKQVQLVIIINRPEGAGLGIRIAGGKGSNPYKDDDEGIFITKILPESPALATGLKVGDKLLKVNQIDLNDLTHQQAADTLKDAVKSGSQLALNVLQEIDLNKLFFLQIPSMTVDDHANLTSGFRINYNFNTYQQREVEVIFIADHKRFGQLSKGDILLQINGKNVDAMAEKELNKFVLNSSNPQTPSEYHIDYLTIYRPFIEGQLKIKSKANGNDDDGSFQQDNERNNGGGGADDDDDYNGRRKGPAGPDDDQDGAGQQRQSDSDNVNGDPSNQQSSPFTQNSIKKTVFTNGGPSNQQGDEDDERVRTPSSKPFNGHATPTLTTTATTTSAVKVAPPVQMRTTANGETPKAAAQQPALINPPISSSTPLRNSAANGHINDSPTPVKQDEAVSAYPIEEIRINKINGAMGLSIVGGGNVACHPFGIDRPGIFISKIVPDGPASHTSLRVGDRILQVNQVDVADMPHDDVVDELKRNVTHVTLLVSRDPQPSGMQDVVISRAYPEETLGIRINGGIENKSANPYDSTDEGIFVVNIINGTLAQKDGRLQVGTRIMEVNGHSLLGVKLSEAQAYLVKSCDNVHMVVCDGFNHLLPKSALNNENNGLGGEVNGHQLTNGHSSSRSSPFPRPPPQPPARNSANLNLITGHDHQANGNGVAASSLSSSSASTTSSASSTTSSNGHSDTDLPPEPPIKPATGYVNGYKLNKPIVPLPTATSSKHQQLPPLSSSNSSSNCNYDNLRNIDDSDDSHVTSPADGIPAHHLNGNGHQNSSSSSRLSSSNGNGHVSSNGNGVKAATMMTPAALTNNTIQQPASAPITDKNLMKSIINKTISNSSGDPKSQSMFTSNESTPVLAKPQSDSVRSFRDKMQFFETVKDNSQTNKPKTKFSYLQEHEIQKIKQEEERKMSSMSQDEILSLSRLEYGDDITNHKDYATFFSN